MRWQFWNLETLFLLFACLALAAVPAFMRAIQVTWRDLRVPLVAAAAALLLATFVAPRTSRIFYDEQIYQSVGQNLADLKRAQMCNDGNVEYGVLQCWRGEYNKEPYGYPYLLSLLYRVFGAHDGLANALNSAAAALLVIVVAITAITLTGSTRAGAFAATICALIPEQLRWSHTAAAEPTATLACAVAVLAALAFVRTRTTAALFWTAMATAAAVQFRPECVLVVPVVIATLALLAPGAFREERFWWAGLAGFVALAMHTAHFMAVRHEGWGTTGPRISLGYAPMNLSTNLWFYLTDARFPTAYTLLAIAAFVMWRKRALAIPALHFLAFWGIFIVFYAGSYNYGADDRFSLMTTPAIAVLAGIGAWRLSERLTGTLPPFRARAAIGAAIIVQFLWYLPFVRSVGEEAWAARADVAFARSFVPQLPPNSIVLTHNPNMFHIWGQSAAQAGIAIAEPHYVTSVLGSRYAGGVFFHWNFWCDVADPVQQAVCTNALERYPHTLVREYRERDYRYALYRLQLPPQPQETAPAASAPVTGR
jgi:4-amino-4-deoxy-L-arabinose transferase-like glycosyltransferase